MAALQKTEGEVFYTDIQNILRDEYLENISRTPFFVFQSTGRECFVSDAKILDGLRKKTLDVDIDTESANKRMSASVSIEKTLKSLLEEKEAQITNPNQIQTVSNGIFDSIKKKMSGSEFSEFFDIE